MRFSNILKGVIPIVLLLMLVIPVSATTNFNDAVINTERTGLEIDYGGNNYIFWSVDEVLDGETKIRYVFSLSELTHVKEVGDNLEITYGAIGVFTLSQSEEGVLLEFEDRIGQKYADAVLTLVYEVNGVGYTVALTKARVGVYATSMVLPQAVEKQSFLERLQEWFSSLF